MQIDDAMLKSLGYQSEGFRKILERSRQFRALGPKASKVVLLKFLVECCFCNDVDFAKLPETIREHAETDMEFDYLQLLSRIGRAFGREDYNEHSRALEEFLSKYPDDLLVSLVQPYFEFQQ
jgi:hypothetical protein